MPFYDPPNLPALGLREAFNPIEARWGPDTDSKVRSGHLMEMRHKSNPYGLGAFSRREGETRMLRFNQIVAHPAAAPETPSNPPPGGAPPNPIPNGGGGGPVPGGLPAAQGGPPPLGGAGWGAGGTPPPFSWDPIPPQGWSDPAGPGQFYSSRGGPQGGGEGGVTSVDQQDPAALYGVLRPWPAFAPSPWPPWEPGDTGAAGAAGAAGPAGPSGPTGPTGSGMGSATLSSWMSEWFSGAMSSWQINTGSSWFSTMYVKFGLP